MKKIFSVTLVTLTLFILCSCGANQGTKLDLTNYEDYLSIEKEHYIGGEKESFSDNRSDIVSEISIKGVSTNHIYKNVEVDFHLMGKYYVDDEGANSDYYGFSTKTIDRIITVKCNVAGNGEIVDLEPTGGYINSNMVDVLVCEVSEIRGTVTEN